MNAAPHPKQFAFAALCAHRSHLVAAGTLLACEAADELQAFAEHTGLIAAIGQDAAQDIMGEAFAFAHTMAPNDADELAEACEQEIMLRAADLVAQWEIADHRDRWRHTGERRPAVRPKQSPRREPYAPPQSTVDAFLYVAALDEIERLEAWLDEHRRDAPILLKLLKAKLCE